MAKQFSAAQIFLWLLVILLGISIGSGLYETLVVMPHWVNAPPDSVTAFYQHNAANPQYTLRAGEKFWMFQTPLVGLTAIAVFFTGLRTSPEVRKWQITGGGLTILLVIATFAWFVPNLIKLQSADVMAMSGEEIKNLTNLWVRLNWVRIMLYLTAWFCTIRAYKLSANSNINRTFGK